MSDTTTKDPITNVELLKLLLSDGLAQALVEAASSGTNRDEAIAATRKE